MGWLLLRLPQGAHPAMRLFGAAAHPPGHPPARPSTTTHPRQWPLTVAPSPVTAARCCAVKGESHMNVFIAGASIYAHAASRPRRTFEPNFRPSPPHPTHHLSITHTDFSTLPTAGWMARGPSPSNFQAPAQQGTARGRRHVSSNARLAHASSCRAHPSAVGLPGSCLSPSR